MKVVLGMDIGGTNSKIAIVNEEGEILERGHLNTRKYNLFEDYVEAVTRLVSDMNREHAYDIQGFGIGAPNGNYYSGMIEFAPNLLWKGDVRVVEKMHEALDIPVFITNDANAAAIGEKKFGIAGDYKDFVMITLGTGVGSGVVVNGELVYGHDGFAGEVGHMTSTYDGRECGCGRLGCVEAYSSVTGLRKTVYELHNDKNKPGLLADQSFEDLTGKKIEQAALKGDEVAKTAFELAGRELGKILANVTAVVSPKAFVLFGGLVNAGALIFDPVKKHFEANLLPIYKNKIDIIPSGLKGNDAAILGAAALAWNELNKA